MDEGQRARGLAPAGDESELSPEAALGLIASERRRALRSLQPDTAVILGVWGVAWLVGFGVTWLASSGWLGRALPPWIAGATIVTLSAAATLVTFGQVLARGRGVHGPSRGTSSLYGWSWLLAMVCLCLLDLALEHQGLPAHLAPLLWTGSTLLVVGLLYLAGGMIWADLLLYGLGAWVLVTGAGSVALGVPANFAVLSLAGGGGFLVAAVAARVRSWQSAPARS